MIYMINNHLKLFERHNFYTFLVSQSSFPLVGVNDTVAAVGKLTEELCVKFFNKHVYCVIYLSGFQSLVFILIVNDFVAERN